MMKLKFITCSGPNEHTSKDKLLDLMDQFPLAEIAVQVSEKKCFKGSPRYDWIHNLQRRLLCERMIINAALHVNLEWCNDFAKGDVAPDLLKILNLRDYDRDYMFKRVQLNFTIGVTEKPDPNKLYNVISSFPQYRFVLPYNIDTAKLVHRLYRYGLKFDCLYDESFGKGILPASRRPVVFPDVLQGYAGGINPDNVEQELDKIAVAHKKSISSVGVFIDAHKGLETDNHFDLAKCRLYLERATQWYKENR